MSEPGPPTIGSAPKDARDWLAEAEAAYASGEGERAIYAAREVLAKDGHNPRAWELRARSSFALKRYSDAEFEAREAVRLAPDRASGHELLAGVYEVQERYEDAAREAQTAIRLEPSNQMHQAVLGSIYLSRGNTVEGRRVFEDLATKHPQEELFQRQLAVAFNDEITQSWTHAPDGSRLITTVEQIQSTRSTAERALSLKFNDDELRQSLRESSAAANLAETKRWRRPRYLRAYVISAFVLFVVAVSATGMRSAGGALLALTSVAAIGLLVWIYVIRHHRPIWQLDAEQIRRREPRR